MATVLMTGATGYLGTYAATWLLEHTDVDLALLVRAPDRTAAIDKLWHAWQLVVDGPTFGGWLDRIRFLDSDLHAPGLGLSAADRAWLDGRIDSVIHGAASLNRKSEKACLNTNVRGTLSVVQLARELHATQPLRRFTFVSTVAVAGERQSEDVGEDDAIDWTRSDYDPYARTKKTGELMVRELLADVPTVVVRPSIAMGDPERIATTQFDMIFATTMLYDLRVLPLDPDGRIDIVNADWVGRSLARLHHKPVLAHDTYHLSAGAQSLTVRELCEAMDAHTGRHTRFMPRLEGGWEVAYRLMNRMPRGTHGRAIGALWKVFWPYVTNDTVFLADRVVAELGEAPTPFTTYAGPMYDWVKAHRFRYPHRPLPRDLR